MTADWPVASTGADDDVSAGMAARLNQYLTQRGAGVDGVVVIHRARLVYETYTGRYDANSLHIMNSCTKSFLSALVGIAIDVGHVDSLDLPILSHLPEYAAKADDPRKARITLKHLLTMTSGIEWPQHGPDNISDRMGLSQNWVGFILDQPMAAEPGTQVNYSNGDAHLIAAILQRATDSDLLAFARAHLFTPLGITSVRWDRDPQGINIGSATMYLRPRDMAKLGQLVLNHGSWHNRQVLSPRWMREATTSHVKMPSKQLTDYEAFAAERGERRAAEDDRSQPDITQYLYDERPARKQTVEIREGWGTGRRVGTLTTWARHRTEPGWWGLVIDRATGEGRWHSAGDLYPFSEFG